MNMLTDLIAVDGHADVKKISLFNVLNVCIITSGRSHDLALPVSALPLALERPFPTHCHYSFSASSPRNLEPDGFVSNTGEPSLEGVESGDEV